MTEGRMRLAEYVVRRRAELGLTQIQVAQRGPLSLDRVQAIEGAKRSGYRASTLFALERALTWKQGSAKQILTGGEPAIPEQLVDVETDSAGAMATRTGGALPASDSWRGLGERVRQRREVLRLSIDEAAARAPMAATTWTRVEQGKAVRGLTFSGVDKVLSWNEGACKAFLASGIRPTVVHRAFDGNGVAATERAQVVVQPEVDFGIGNTPPFPAPRDEAEREVNETWQAAKLLEAVMQRQRKRLQPRGI